MLQPSAEISAVCLILRITYKHSVGKNANISKPEQFPTLATVPQQDEERGDSMTNQQQCTTFIT